MLNRFAKKPIILFLASFLMTCAFACKRAASTSSSPPANVDSKSWDEPLSTTDADTELIQKIRGAIVQDSSLATVARDIDIKNENGSIVLQGWVRSPEQRTKVQALTEAIAGDQPVRNELLSQGKTSQ